MAFTSASPEFSGLVALEVAEAIAEVVREAGMHWASDSDPPSSAVSSGVLCATAHMRSAPANASAGKGSESNALGRMLVGSMRAG